jgi:hypothetical protein
MYGYRLNEAMEWEDPGMSGITFRRYLGWYEQHADCIWQIMLAIDARFYKVLIDVPILMSGANK